MDMLERAAAAVQQWCEEHNNCFPLYYEQQFAREKRLDADEDAEDDLAQVSLSITRAALLAALDPEDVRLRELVMPFVEGSTAVQASENARQVIAAIRWLAQGEQRDAE